MNVKHKVQTVGATGGSPAQQINAVSQKIMFQAQPLNLFPKGQKPAAWLKVSLYPHNTKTQDHSKTCVSCYQSEVFLSDSSLLTLKHGAICNKPETNCLVQKVSFRSIFHKLLSFLVSHNRSNTFSPRRTLPGDVWDNQGMCFQKPLFVQRASGEVCRCELQLFVML